MHVEALKIIRWVRKKKNRREGEVVGVTIWGLVRVEISGKGRPLWLNYWRDGEGWLGRREEKGACLHPNLKTFISQIYEYSLPIGLYLNLTSSVFKIKVCKPKSYLNKIIISSRNKMNSFIFLILIGFASKWTYIKPINPIQPNQQKKIRMNLDWT